MVLITIKNSAFARIQNTTIFPTRFPHKTLIETKKKCAIAKLECECIIRNKNQFETPFSRRKCRASFIIFDEKNWEIFVLIQTHFPICVYMRKKCLMNENCILKLTRNERKMH